MKPEEKNSSTTLYSFLDDYFFSFVSQEGQITYFEIMSHKNFSFRFAIIKRYGDYLITYLTNLTVIKNYTRSKEYLIR